MNFHRLYPKPVQSRFFSVFSARFDDAFEDGSGEKDLRGQKVSGDLGGSRIKWSNQSYVVVPKVVF